MSKERSLCSQTNPVLFSELDLLQGGGETRVVWAGSPENLNQEPDLRRRIEAGSLLAARARDYRSTAVPLYLREAPPVQPVPVERLHTVLPPPILNSPIVSVKKEEWNF